MDRLAARRQRLDRIEEALSAVVRLIRAVSRDDRSVRFRGGSSESRGAGEQLIRPSTSAA